jgi:hypothetical protein
MSTLLDFAVWMQHGAALTHDTEGVLLPVLAMMGSEADVLACPVDSGDPRVDLPWMVGVVAWAADAHTMAWSVEAFIQPPEAGPESVHRRTAIVTTAVSLVDGSRVNLVISRGVEDDGSVVWDVVPHTVNHGSLAELMFKASKITPITEGNPVIAQLGRKSMLDMIERNLEVVGYGIDRSSPGSIEERVANSAIE